MYCGAPLSTPHETQCHDSHKHSLNPLTNSLQTLPAFARTFTETALKNTGSEYNHSSINKHTHTQHWIVLTACHILVYELMKKPWLQGSQLKDQSV